MSRRTKALEVRQAEMILRKHGELPPQEAALHTLPGEQEVLRHLWARAKSGKQGSSQALKTYLEYVVGKATQRKPQNTGPQLTQEVAELICSIAERYAPAAFTASAQPNECVQNTTEYGELDAELLATALRASQTENSHIETDTENSGASLT